MVPQVKSEGADHLQNMGKRTCDNEGFTGTVDEESAYAVDFEMTEIHNGSVGQRGYNNGAASEQKTTLTGTTDADDVSLSQPLLDSGEEESAYVEKDPAQATTVEPDEAAWQIALQVSVPYIIAGLGMVGAGMVLDKVQVSAGQCLFIWVILLFHFNKL